ncbi:MAG: BBP7 family outer membrane beta-barrel protein [Pirellulaceae bacterium]
MSRRRGSLLVVLAVLLLGTGLPHVRAEEDANESAKEGTPPATQTEPLAASAFPAAPTHEPTHPQTPPSQPSGLASTVSAPNGATNTSSPQIPFAVAPSQLGPLAIGYPGYPQMAMVPAPMPQTAAGPAMPSTVPYMAPYGPSPYGPSPYGPSPYGPSPYGPPASMGVPGGAVGYPPAGLGYGGVHPAAFYDGMPNPPQPFAPEQGSLVPVGYGIEMAGQCATGGCPDGGGDCGPYCGGTGCQSCRGAGVTGGYLTRLFGRVLPFSEGGRSAPRWYDVTIDFLYLTRENVSRQVDFSSDGILGDIVLSTETLDFSDEGALRFTAAAQVWAGGNVEFTYLGLANWSTGASFTSPTDELFSVFSDFGVNPFGGFDETDRASFHSIGYSSSIDSFELHFRKRWTGPNGRLQGSWLAGVRYVYLLEDFEYFTVGGDDPGTPQPDSRGQMDYDVRTHNSLTGPQIGGDLWTSVIPGISIGAEGKAGVYGNYAQQSTQIVATTSNPALTNTLSERDNSSDVALIGEASLLFIYRTSPNWTIRGGYTFVYLDGVALAPENFNSTVPFSSTRTLQPLNDNGSVLLHGFTAGLEWMW